MEQQEAASDESAAEEVYKERSPGLTNPEDGPMFCGITESMEGIVDTAAEGGLIGSEALGRLMGELAKYGLKPKWTNKKASAKGVGGTARSLGVVSYRSDSWNPRGHGGARRRAIPTTYFYAKGIAGGHRCWE